METSSISPARQLHAQQSWGRAADAFDAVAWRPPTSARFVDRVANDPVTPEPTLKELIADLPGWVTVVGGGAVAALMGAMMGGALAL